MGMVVKRFDVYLVSLDPTVGGEMRIIDKSRLVRKLGQISKSAQRDILTTLAEMFAE